MRPRLKVSSDRLMKPIIIVSKSEYPLHVALVYFMTHSNMDFKASKPNAGEKDLLMTYTCWVLSAS